MQKNYTVAEGHEFTYPADAVSLRLVKEAGGVSQMTDAERAQVKFKTVKAGEDCSDMPLSSAAIYAKRGWIVEKGATTPAVVPAVTSAAPTATVMDKALATKAPEGLPSPVKGGK
jgi:hypothetical protein